MNENGGSSVTVIVNTESVIDYTIKHILHCTACEVCERISGWSM
jgi:hypothetical protein